MIVLLDEWRWCGGAPWFFVILRDGSAKRGGGGKVSLSYCDMRFLSPTRPVLYFW